MVWQRTSWVEEKAAIEGSRIFSPFRKSVGWSDHRDVKFIISSSRASKAERQSRARRFWWPWTPMLADEGTTSAV